MWDWILAARFLGEILTGISIIVILPIAAVSVIGYIRYVCGETKKDEYIHYKKFMKILFSGAILFSVVNTISLLPQIMVKANIDRVKINYTSPQAISKIESGALQVVNKLDKLIDKGIDSIGTKPTPAETKTQAGNNSLEEKNGKTGADKQEAGTSD